MDIGAGDGRYSVPLLYKFKKGYAIEVEKSPGLAEVSRLYPNLHYSKELIQKTRIKEKIDFVLMVDVFEHIPVKDVPGFVKKIDQMQAKGGVVYILTPNAVHCGPASQSGLHHTRLPFGHHKQYVRQEIEQVFSRYRYETIFCAYEDSHARLLVKHFIMIVSMIDNKLSKNTVYRTLSAPMVFALDLFFHVVSFFVCWVDRCHQDDVYETRSMVLVLKKLT
jgi:hypothetical protein